MSPSFTQTLRLAMNTMAGFPSPWSLCGGWAIDAWLGHQTRAHADVDLAVFERDQRALFEHLRGWNLVAHDALEPESREPWSGRELVLPAHIHARPPASISTSSSTRLRVRPGC